MNDENILIERLVEPLRGKMVLQVLPALGEGGVEQSAEDMAFFLQKHGVMACVAAAKTDSVVAARRIGLIKRGCAGFFDVPLQSKWPWMILVNALRLLWIMRRKTPALVHARSRMPAWSAWLAARLLGVPFVATFHGTYGVRGGWLKRFYNSVMLRGRVVIANSHYIKAHIVETYKVDPQRVVVAARGVDTEIFNPELFDAQTRKTVRIEMGVPERVPMLVMVGRLTRWKGQDILLRALAEMKDVPWHLVLVGGPDKRGVFARELRELSVELGLTERVTFAGSRQDVARVMNAATLALSCSVEPEAFGRVAVEAMAMGVPVVATRLGGSIETVVDGSTGWLVPLVNGVLAPQALAQTLREALREPKRLATMGQVARAHVLSSYTVERCCVEELRAYRMVLGLDPLPHGRPTPTI